jgi:hypothetical protein
MMESVAVMALSVLSSPGAEPSVAQPVCCSAAQRRRLLSDVLAMKLRLGYEILSESEFSAVVCTPSPRRWLWTRTGRQNTHLTIAIDEAGITRLVKSYPGE